jgi:Lar family restriction alleviation protein
MSEELKPCPFCGRSPQMSSRPQTQVEGCKFVTFISCMCNGYSASAHRFGIGEDMESAKTSAITAWNHRHPEPKVLTVEFIADLIDRNIYLMFGYQIAEIILSHMPSTDAKDKQIK